MSPADMRTMASRQRRAEWQRRSRAAFKAAHGYSNTSNYGAGGMRAAVLARDNFRCVTCGMTDEEHRAQWSRPITIDHINRNRADNRMENLQTLCLRCHGRKDITPRLKARRVEQHKSEIMRLRASGVALQKIADELGFSIASIWKWTRAWEAEQQTTARAK